MVTLIDQLLDFSHLFKNVVMFFSLREVRRRSWI